MGKEHIFMLNGKLVGYFARTEYPRAPGRFRYIPFRDAAHEELQRQLRDGESPRCYFDTGREIISFVVHDFPAYGEVVIRDFETLPREFG
jgi:hypothetical protein